MPTMEERLNALFDAASADYERWCGEAECELRPDFRGEFKLFVGKKFIKITNENCTFGFIVIDHPRWQLGDMLKAESWSKPAQNFRRGNIFNDADIARVKWTGIA